MNVERKRTRKRRAKYEIRSIGNNFKITKTNSLSRTHLSVDSIVGLCLHHTHALALWNCWPRDGRCRPDGPTTTTDAHFGDPRGHRPVVDFYLLLRHLRRRRRRPHCGTVHRAAPEHFAARGHYCCDGGAAKRNL